MKSSPPSLRLQQSVRDLKRTLQAHLPQLLLHNAASAADVEMASIQQSLLHYQNYSSLHSTLDQASPNYARGLNVVCETILSGPRSHSVNNEKLM